MSMNLVSIRDRVAFRIGHVSVAYKETVLLWGGHKEYFGDYGDFVFPTDELCIFDCHKETWHIRMLKGDIPPKLTSPGAAVLGDALYVSGGFVFGRPIDREDGEDLYKLNLITMKWHRLNPQGVPPLPCNKMAAWSYGNKVYFFGGFGRQPKHRLKQFNFVVDEKGKAWSNQLVAYNTETDRWEWPTTRGNPPLPRAAHACDITGSEVYIMGGRVLDVRMDDLYSLDMETMTWSDNLADSYPDDPKPEGRSWHTLTFFAPDKAVIYGGWNTGAEILDDCWILETKRPVRFRLFNSIFDTKRFWHQTVYNPLTGDIICIGEDCWVMAILRKPKKVLSWSPYSLGHGFKYRRCHAAIPTTDFDGNKMILVLGGYIDPEVGMDNSSNEPPNIPRYRGRCAYFEENLPGFILMNFLPKSLLRLSVDSVLEAKERTRPYWSELPKKLCDLLVTREACIFSFVYGCGINRFRWPPREDISDVRHSEIQSVLPESEAEGNKLRVTVFHFDTNFQGLDVM